MGTRLVFKHVAGDVFFIASSDVRGYKEDRYVNGNHVIRALESKDIIVEVIRQDGSKWYN